MGRRNRKVLHILNELRYSGAETMLAVAGAHFAAAGYVSHILATGAVPGEFAPNLERAGYVLHHIPFAKNRGFFAAVRRLIADGGYDVVHIHCERAYPIYAALAAPFARVVRTIHHNFAFTGALRMRKIVERAICRFLFRTVQISVSASVSDNERRRFFSRGPLCLNWYDDGAFFPPSDAQRAAARRGLAIDDGDIVLISVGNNAPYKNYDAVLDALVRLDADKNFRYIHVGETNNEFTGIDLRQMSIDRKIDDKVIFPGKRSDVNAYLRAADIYVMPSLAEGFGIAAVEAMACGLPVILSDNPGLTDFDRLAPGIVYSGTNAAELARRIAGLAVLSDEARRRIGAGLAEAMKREFSTAAGVRRYLALYDETC